MSTNKVDEREAWIAKGDRLNHAVAIAAHDNGYMVRGGADAVNSARYKILSDARKYWREGEPLYMVAPEAIDNAAPEGK